MHISVALLLTATPQLDQACIHHRAIIITTPPSNLGAKPFQHASLRTMRRLRLEIHLHPSKLLMCAFQLGQAILNSLSDTWLLKYLHTYIRILIRILILILIFTLILIFILILIMLIRNKEGVRGAQQEIGFAFSYLIPSHNSKEDSWHSILPARSLPFALRFFCGGDLQRPKHP